MLNMFSRKVINNKSHECNFKVLQFLSLTPIIFYSFKNLNWIHPCISACSTFTSLCLFMTVVHGKLINMLYQNYLG